MTFYLGTHQPHWLRLLSVPLFVSYRRLRDYKTLPKAIGPRALASGGFSELSMYGRWVTTATEYVAAVRRYMGEIGSMVWAAIQDWMCEPHMLQLTGMTVAEHQARTIASYLELQSLAPEVPWVPVLQGWEPKDYMRHREAYAAAGVDLSALPLVGLGSVCRRQHMGVLATIVRSLQPLHLHGFGIKLQGLAAIGHLLTSADSMAWSAARRDPPLPGCAGHINCANCQVYALRWRERVGEVLRTPRQPDLFGGLL